MDNEELDFEEAQALVPDPTPKRSPPPPPEPVNSATNQAGTRLEFWERPYRHYRINPTTDNPMHEWSPVEPWGRVPSVTAVNGVLDKSGPLVGWATNITYEACAELAQTYGPPPGGEIEGNHTGGRTTRAYLLRDAARRYSLDHNSVTKEAQLRGTTVHRIGEDWQTEGKFPTLADHPPEWHGYIRAIAKFLAAHGEGLSVAEEITGSVEHGFAGTCDTVAVSTFGDSRVRLDYKTSKNCYARTHFRQLGAYELGAVEGGDEPCDRLGIVILGADGEFHISYADECEWRTTPADSFLRVLDVWRDEVPLKKHEDAAYKARIARERATNG